MAKYKAKEGWRPVSIWFSPGELAKLDMLRVAMDKSHNTEVIRRLLRDAKVEDYK